MRLLRRLTLSASAIVAGLACNSFGASDPGGEPRDPGVDAASPPEEAGADATSPGTDAAPACPARTFCDDFEREDVRGNWEYPASTSAGESALAIDAATAASGSRSLAATTGINDASHANALVHRFIAPPIIPFKVTFALRVDALPRAEVQIMRVVFDTASSIWITLDDDGLRLGMEAQGGGGSSSGSNAAELATLGAWARYTLQIEASRATLALDNGTRSATIVPYPSEFGRSQEIAVGMPRVEPSTASASLWLDDLVMPE